MSHTSAQLRELLDRIFEDGLVDAKERAELLAAKADLDAASVLAVFKKFLNDKWGEVSADDVLTGKESALLGRIVDELGLSFQDLPHQAQYALRHQFSIKPKLG